MPGWNSSGSGEVQKLGALSKSRHCRARDYVALNSRAASHIGMSDTSGRFRFLVSWKARETKTHPQAQGRVCAETAGVRQPKINKDDKYTEAAGNVNPQTERISSFRRRRARSLSVFPTKRGGLAASLSAVACQKQPLIWSESGRAPSRRRRGIKMHSQRHAERSPRPRATKFYLRCA